MFTGASDAIDAGRVAGRLEASKCFPSIPNTPPVRAWPARLLSWLRRLAVLRRELVDGVSDIWLRRLKARGRRSWAGTAAAAGVRNSMLEAVEAVALWVALGWRAPFVESAFAR